METAIELHQLPEVRHPLAASAMRAALARSAPEPRGQHPSPERVVMDIDAVLAGQVLGRQRRPEPLVDRSAIFFSHQRQDARTLRGIPRRIRAAPSAAVFQSFRAFRPVSSIQALRLTIAHRHDGRR
jgi:hypothetical protein